MANRGVKERGVMGGVEEEKRIMEGEEGKGDEEGKGEGREGREGRG